MYLKKKKVFDKLDICKQKKKVFFNSHVEAAQTIYDSYITNI